MIDRISKTIVVLLMSPILFCVMIVLAMSMLVLPIAVFIKPEILKINVKKD